MTDVSKRMDELLAGGMNTPEDVEEFERLASVELRMQSGQGEAFAQAASQEGDLLSGKTAEALARLKRLNGPE